MWDPNTPTLPPEIPLTEKELADPLLQPLPPTPPPSMFDADSWEVVITKELTRSFTNMAEMFVWLIEHRYDFEHEAHVYRHRKGDLA